MNDRPKRKTIPVRVMAEVRERQKNICTECNTRLSQNLGDITNYDHRPPISERPVNAAGSDYEPPQLDPAHIEALHEPCHQKRTTGRAIGAERTATTKGSDAWRRAKFRKLEKPRKARTTIRPRGFNSGRKMKIPSRPFPKRKP